MDEQGGRGSASVCASSLRIANEKHTATKVLTKGAVRAVGADQPGSERERTSGRTASSENP